jgi:hypothetical protein
VQSQSTQHAGRHTTRKQTKRRSIGWDASLLVRLGVGFTIAALSGCGAGAAVGPSETLNDYAAALREGDAPRAYSLLSSEARQQITLPAFERMLREDPATARELAEALTNDVQSSEVVATVSTPQGETLQLVYENGAWKADLDAVDLYSQATPRRAVTSFVRAYKARRYEILLRFVPTSEREGMSADTLKQAWEGPQKEDMARLVAALQIALPSATIEVVGNRASIPYAAGASVQLLNEDGLWKIEEF